MQLGELVNKTGLIFLLVIGGMAGGAIASVSYYWHQVTQLPDWYTEAPTETDLATIALEANRSQVIDKLLASRQQPAAPQVVDTASSSLPEEDDPVNIDAHLTEAELNQLLVVSLVNSPNLQPILAGTRGINTTIDNGELASGGVVNLSAIPAEHLGEREQQMLERVKSLFPALADRDIYVGIEGEPRIEDGAIRLSDDTLIKLGNISLSVSQLDGILGISQAQLEQELTFYLREGRLDIQAIELGHDGVRVEGSLH